MSGVLAREAHTARASPLQTRGKKESLHGRAEAGKACSSYRGALLVVFGRLGGFQLGGETPTCGHNERLWARGISIWLCS